MAVKYILIQNWIHSTAMGGFKMQDQMLSNDLERLKLELENLKNAVEPPVSEKVKTITEIAASITSALAFAFGRVQP